MRSAAEAGGAPYDVAVVGAGAAGLMAAIFASRDGLRVAALDGASRIGAKILISGGGRCNVTHDVVRAEDFHGNRNAIGKVLRSFDVPETVAFFESHGVRLKREETGKLFPVTDKARTVVDALLRAASGVEILTGTRVEAIDPGFTIHTNRGPIAARHVILATGGRSVPKTGSDGHGYAIARSLGHSVSELFPALVPLILDPVPPLAGTSVDCELSVRSPSGRVLQRERGAMLFTHFGISGPAVLDVSRHWIAVRRGGEAAALYANLLPGETSESLDSALVAEAARNPRGSLAGFLRRRLPERIVSWILEDGPHPAFGHLLPEGEGHAVGAPLPLGEGGAERRVRALGQLTRQERRSAVRALVDLPLPVVRDRGFDYAEVTAGGVPLSEVDVGRMASRVCEGLFLCGEILDVDGRIGGYNFQWAWASGRLAGLAAARFA